MTNHKVEGGVIVDILPKDVVWVYTTGRFHSITTRDDLGDEFAVRWQPRADHFPVAWRADFLPDELHHAPNWIAHGTPAGVRPRAGR